MCYFAKSGPAGILAQARPNYYIYYITENNAKIDYLKNYFWQFLLTNSAVCVTHTMIQMDIANNDKIEICMK